jgi:hypothetical protein
VVTIAVATWDIFLVVMMMSVFTIEFSFFFFTVLLVLVSGIYM